MSIAGKEQKSFQTLIDEIKSKSRDEIREYFSQVDYLKPFAQELASTHMAGGPLCYILRHWTFDSYISMENNWELIQGLYGESISSSAKHALAFFIDELLEPYKRVDNTKNLLPMDTSRDNFARFDPREELFFAITNAPDKQNWNTVDVSIRTPLIGRDKELCRIFRIIDINYSTGSICPSTIAISGASGIGKTRLGLQVAQDKFFDLSLTMTVPSDGIIPEKNVLVSKHLEDIEVALDDWISPRIPSHAENRGFKVIIYIDQIQNLPIAQLRAIRHGIYLFFLRDARVFIQLIVSGVDAMYLPIEMWPKDDLLRDRTGNLVVINLLPLDTKESAQFLLECLKAKRPLNECNAIASQPVVQQALNLAGGNARLIEFIAKNVTQNNNELQPLHDAVMSSCRSFYGSQFYYYKVLYECLVQACTTKMEVSLEGVIKSKENPNETVKVSHILKSGIAMYHANEGKDWLFIDLSKGYLSVPQFELDYLKLCKDD